MYRLIAFSLCSLPWKQGRKNSTLLKRSTDHVLNERNKNNEDENHSQKIIVVNFIALIQGDKNQVGKNCLTKQLAEKLDVIPGLKYKTF